MRFHALACDYDGTIATEGRVPPPVVEALERLKRSGRTLILVTGRTLDETLTRFAGLSLFSRVVLENGGVLYRPATHELKPLARRPPKDLLERLTARGVEPLHAGHVVVATREPHETAALEVVRELGLEMHVVFNKGAVMLLPSGVNKASGLQAALRELDLSAHNVVAVGDAENDHALLDSCECAVAVANALPSLREKADWVTSAPAGAGVAELAERLLDDDFAEVGPRLVRRDLLLGEAEDGRPVRVPPSGIGLLIAGPSGGGKSTLAGGILERLRTAEYQFCVVDPEGDFQDAEGIAALGGRDRIPAVKEALDVLAAPDQNLALNLLGVPLDARPAYLQELMPALMGMQGRTGRPHWIVLDEAHHVYPDAGPSAGWTIPGRPDALLVVTVDPAHVAPDLRAWIDVAVFLGAGAAALLNRFLGMIGFPPVAAARNPSAPGEALAWRKSAPSEALLFRVRPSEMHRRRHGRKYAEGDLGPDKSFCFRGPEGKLNLRAQNLAVFLQMSDGVDDDTWTFHLRRGDYSRWFREAIKDPGLASLARQVEQAGELGVAESRAMIRKLVEDHYTAPA
jgi:hydroxymethylpyrimidine pyrophosphatase-like HAD family hydrolase